MLSEAGIKDATKQLQINVILNSWALVVSVTASFFSDKIGRKALCEISLAGCTIFFYLVGGLTGAYGTSTNTSGIYGTLAAIFLFVGSYHIGITPLTVLYPPEILSYRIRATGMGLYTLTTKLFGLLVTMAFPYSFAAIGWKTYMINASFNILLLLVVVFYWVETKGLTLEEVDKRFDGVKHSLVPDWEELKSGKAEFLTEALEVPDFRNVEA
jgi:MFS family permease